MVQTSNNLITFLLLSLLSFHDDFRSFGDASVLFPSNFLPSSLTFLEFGKSFNQPINLSQLSHLTHLSYLSFGHIFNQDVNDMLLSSLTFLSLVSLKYQLKSLPPKLIHLDLGQSYNNPIPSLPSSITRKNLGQLPANNVVISTLPPSLKHLSFPNSFFQPIDSLPDTLTYLYLPLIIQ